MGLLGAGRLNDLWAMDLPTRTWAWVGGAAGANADAPGAYGARGLPSSTAWPGARDGHSVAVDARGVLWVFGGEGYATQGAALGLLNDLWAFAPTPGRDSRGP